MRTSRWKAPLLLAALAAAAPARAERNSFIQDDIDRARAEAAARKLPLLVEVWAPW